MKATEIIPYVIDMTHSIATDAELVGKKTANLAVLRTAGFPVPEGFAITTAAFDSFMANMENPAGMPREEWLRRPIPDDVRALIIQSLKDWGDIPLAVRSSGVAEDLKGASFAGQYETVLNVRGVEAVMDAIRKCWASAYSSHIKQYQRSQQIAEARMAVLIQPMIAADCAGVAFTANPVTGNPDETTVSAVRGLGEKLVSGEVTPDEWVVRDGEARCIHAPERAVTSKEVHAVAWLSRQVEQHFGCPQDIEWAICNGKLFLLQARPITALGGAGKVSESPVHIDVPHGFWEREASHHPQPLYPITSSFYPSFLNQAFQSSFNEICLLLETIEAKEIGGYIYQRVVPLGGKDRKSPPKWMMSALIKTVPSLRKRIRICQDFIEKERHTAIIEQWYTDWKPEYSQRFHSFRDVELKRLSDTELTQHLKNITDFMEQSLRVHMMLNGSINLALAEFAFACRDWLGWAEGMSMELLSGLSETSSEPSRLLAQLANRLKENPELVRLLERIDGQTIHLMREVDSDWVQAFDDYLKQYGYRAIRYEVCDPILLEMPELTLSLLKDQLTRNYDPAAQAAELLRKRTSCRLEAHKRLADQPERLKVFERLIQKAERAYPIREEHGFYDTSTPLAFLRLALLESGARLARRGQIDEAGDIFYLEFPEVVSESAVTGKANFQDAVRRRKQQRRQVLANPGPASYGKVPPPPPPMDILPEKVRFAHEAVMWQLEAVFAAQASGQKQTGSNGLKGIPASEGTYTGPVRVIRNETEFYKIKAGDVLVCPITSPVWSVLFPSVGALITDTGGILSHSAIIAREYRIPSVVATGNATQLLRDGQLVTVNGATGEISFC
ncbi:PEP/pyruvate-binding domain-containing protein [Paenibacillus andongensis]|uniref:PEP/pyruvate-binding domain-containing protein n=1 Tax=Paenibacillus andongensis TaxID=2975482 RepID=UPI0021BAC700|nr:PEP/pyruvate-binding domain-containing protein [Paenibacillus andongensis]